MTDQESTPRPGDKDLPPHKETRLVVWKRRKGWKGRKDENSLTRPTEEVQRTEPRRF